MAFEQTYPRAKIDAARLEYEGNAVSFRDLERMFGISRSHFGKIAQREKWVKFVPSDPAADIETAILVAGLQRRTGRRPKYAKPGTVGVSPQAADERQRLICAREEYEASGHGGHSGQTVTELARKYGFQPGKLRYVARMEGWTKPPPSPAPPPASEPGSGPADRPAEPVPAETPPTPAGASWVKVARETPLRTADVINFPGAAPPAQRSASPVARWLPERSVEDKQKLRVALSAIRAVMSVEQVQQLERHEGLLERYSHLLDMYLHPQRFVSPDGLTEEQHGEEIIRVQTLAARILMPSDRDTLGTTVKTLTDALHKTITLKRAIAGLDKVSPAALRGLTDDADDRNKGPTLDLSAIDVEELRQVQRSMELVERHHRAHQEPPKPPLGQSIDDLLGPEAVVVQEPEDPEGPVGR